MNRRFLAGPVRPDAQIGGEYSLAHIELTADCGNILGFNFGIWSNVETA